MLIAFQGETGAYSEAAGRNSTRPPPSCPARPSRTSSPRSRPAGRPAASSRSRTRSAAPSTATTTCWSRTSCRSSARSSCRSSHSLLALPGTRFEDLKQVYSHPQALAQCDRFLRVAHGRRDRRHLRHGRQRQDDHASNSMAGVGAIASERAAAVFGLETLRAGIQDHADNITRFLIVTRAGARRRVHRRPRRSTRPPSSSRCPTRPAPCSRRSASSRCASIDVTKIESRPTGRPWEYLFHVDLAVGQHELRCARALSHLAEFAPSLKVLGSYPGVARSADTRRRPGRARGRRRFVTLDPKHKSNALTEGPSRAPARAMLKAVGFSDADLHKPLVGIANTWTEIGPCNFHLRRLAAQGQGRHARGRRHADGVQHHRGVGRHHDGHRGHAHLAHQPRGHRRLDRAGRARPSPRRAW